MTEQYYIGIILKRAEGNPGGGSSLLENSLNSRLKTGILIALISGILIVAAGAGVLHMLSDSMIELSYSQMAKETDECKRRIQQQMSKDFQSLNTLAAFFSSKSVVDSEEFAACLDEANHQNEFVTMAYFKKDGSGLLVNNEYGIIAVSDYNEMEAEAVRTIEEAYDGREGSSQLFDSEVSKGRIFIYAVPVYRDGEIIGVLAASNYIEYFSDMIKDHSIMDGAGMMHLVSQSGKILVSPPPQVNAPISDENFFENSYFTKSDQDEILNALAGNKSVFSHLTYEGKTYSVILEPTDIQNWYLMCVWDHKASNRASYEMARTITMMFILLFALVLGLLLFICRMAVKTNRHLTVVAYKDKLTGADNTEKFFLNLNQARETKQFLTIAAVNVHQFKFINEILGTKYADHLLCDISDTIRDALREDEFFCRDSADRFYIVLREAREAEAKLRLESLMRDISSKEVTAKMDYQIQMYAGAYIWTNYGDDVDLPSELLITRVLFAKKYSRGLPDNGIHFYDADVHKSEEMENYVETHMRQALVKGEFKLYLQPKVNLCDGSLNGAEALVRWVTEEGKMIYPDSFIPQFERNGFCVKLDLYMVEEVCRQIRAWMDAGLEPIPVSINQSKLLFFDADYLLNLKQIIEKYKIPASLITLEILEGLALEHAEETNAKIRRLRQMGFRISMDDFGTGYSSLNTLGKLDISELKIDRSFLLEASGSRGSRFRQIMEHVVDMAKGMNITTVVEGVETEENEALIRLLDCDVGQGYLYSRPVSAEEFTQKYMTNRKTDQ